MREKIESEKDEDLVKLKEFVVTISKEHSDNFLFYLPKVWKKIANIRRGDKLEVYMNRKTFDLNIKLIKGDERFLLNKELTSEQEISS